jgi:RNA polymerase sigma factor (TIGR02999 family)
LHLSSAPETSASETSITILLQAWAKGDQGARDQVMPVVYDELRRLASAHMRWERPDHTLSPTALVSEAFLRLSGTDQPAYEHRIQFFALAARQMRRVLLDHARRRTARKRGGSERPVPLHEEVCGGERPEELVALDEALEALEAVDARKARAVELHYFGGLSQKEIAEILSVHVNTVARDLRLAEAWLHRHLRGAR